LRTLVAAAVLLGWALAPPALAWGPVVHPLVVRGAIDALPKQMKSYYQGHRLEIPSLALEPTVPERGPERRFPVDRLLAYPFADLPETEAGLKQRFGDAAAGMGRLPWLIHESYDRLVEAFRAADKEKILAESDTMAGLVADLHNPLSLTENFDGQKTEQHGLWARLTIKLPEAVERDLKLDPGGSFYLDDPKGYVFSMVNQSYVWADNVLYADELARRGKTGYGTIYYDHFRDRVLAVLRDRLSQAARDAASYWYTAWTAAGRPQLK
jgi:hypothetical protein